MAEEYEDLTSPSSRNAGPAPTKRKAIADDAPQRKRVAVACEPCRNRKTKCNGGRPECRPCQALGRECIYEKSEISHAQHVQELEELRGRLDDLERVVIAQRNFVSSRDILQHTTPETNSFFLGNVESSEDLGVQHFRSVAANEHSIHVPYPGFQTERYLSPTSRRGSVLANVSTSVTKLKSLAVPSLMGMCVRSLNQANKSKSGEIANTPSSVETFPSLDYDYMDHCLRNELLRGDILFNNAYQDPLVLNEATFNKLQDSYFHHVNNWFPVMEHSPTWLEHFDGAERSNFKDDSLGTALVLITFAVGAIAASDSPPENDDLVPGNSYLAQAVRIMSKHAYKTDLLLAQCNILLAEYFLLSLQPLPAYHAITTASRQCLILQRIKSRYVRNDRDSQAFARAYWCASILESEINTHLQLEGSDICKSLDSVPLISLGTSDVDLVFFMAQISFMKLKQDMSDALHEENLVIDAPIMADRLQESVEEWYNHLPESLHFSLEPMRLFDDRRAFLRMQYHCAKTIISWPSVASIMEAASDEEANILLQSPRCIAMVDLHMSSCIQFSRGMKEQLSRRTVATWLNAQATFIILLKILVSCRMPILSPFFPIGWHRILRETLSYLIPWLSCPSIKMCHEILQRMCDAHNPGEEEDHFDLTHSMLQRNSNF